MKGLSTLGAVAVSLLTTSVSATPFTFNHLSARNDSSSTCITPRAIPDYKGTDFKNFGMVLFRAVDMIDVFGPLDPLQIMSLSTQTMNLHFIAETLDPIKTQPASMNQFNSSFFPTIPVTHTFDDAADNLDLDVLLVPGGPGVRAPNMEPVEDFIKKMYPKVKLLLTVCTGASLAAKAGVLDDHLATTNKKAWASMIASGPNVQWVSPARYTIDGNIWTSSGVCRILRSLPLLLTPVPCPPPPLAVHILYVVGYKVLYVVSMVG